MMTANYSRKWMMAGLLAFSAFTSPVMAQHNGLVDMSHSKEARMVNMPLGSTRWTGGFWGGRFKVFSETSLKANIGDLLFMMAICINGLRHVLRFMQ